MRIGLMTYEWQELESLHYMARLTDVSLRDRHDVVYCPPQYLQLSRAERVAMVREWVTTCDVLVVPVDELVLQARSEVGSAAPPCVAFIMGMTSRGGLELARTSRHMSTSDIVVGNCQAEVDQTRVLLPNATMRLLPFPVDDTKFYMESPEAIVAAKQRLGFDADARIIVYSGRINLEKNLHTVLKAFSVVRRQIPNSVLVIAGAETNWPFREFGVYAVEVTRMLKKKMASLGLDPAAVRFMGQRGPDELRMLYNVADLMVNLT